MINNSRSNALGFYASNSFWEDLRILQLTYVLTHALTCPVTGIYMDVAPILCICNSSLIKTCKLVKIPNRSFLHKYPRDSYDESYENEIHEVVVWMMKIFVVCLIYILHVQRMIASSISLLLTAIISKLCFKIGKIISEIKKDLLTNNIFKP